MNRPNRNRLKDKNKLVDARGEGGWGVSAAGEGGERSRLADSVSHRAVTAAAGDTVSETAVQEVPTHEQVLLPECVPRLSHGSPGARLTVSSVALHCYSFMTRLTHNTGKNKQDSFHSAAQHLEKRSSPTQQPAHRAWPGQNREEGLLTGGGRGGQMVEPKGHQQQETGGELLSHARLMLTDSRFASLKVHNLKVCM